jgi:hypothetical protein
LRVEKSHLLQIDVCVSAGDRRHRGRVAVDRAQRCGKRTLREQIERNLRQKTLMFAYRVEADRQHSLADITAQEGQAAGARATVVDPTGKVLADSEADPSDGENHAHRRRLSPRLAAKLASTNAAVKALAFLSCMWPRRFREERCGSHIR